MSMVNSITNTDQNINKNQPIKSSATNRTSFSSYMGETKSMDAIFEKAAKKYNVSVDLLKAIGKAESNFNDKAVSKAGAQGVMQLMPATAKSLGVTDSFDAEQNIMGGAKYISDLLKKYNGDTNLALAAYNAGMGNVAKYGGIPPFKETQNYVVKVNNFMKQGISSTNATVTTKAPVTSPIANRMLPAETNTSEQIESISLDLDEIFSYQIYLKFLDKYLEYNKQQEEEKNKNDHSPKINYNMPMINMAQIARPLN